MKTPEDIDPDFPQWPEAWEGLPEDLEYGKALLALMRPFIVHLIDKGLTKKTIDKHMGNLWFLGAEIISDVCTYTEYDIPAEKKLTDSLDANGGPYCRHLTTKAANRSYDATCKKLYKFLKSTSSGTK